MSVGSWFETWTNLLIRPGEVSMEDERAEPQASLGTAMIWVAIGAVLSGIISWIQAMIFVRSFQALGGVQGILAQANLPAEQMDAINQIMNQMPAGVPFLGRPSATFGALIWSIVGSILGFLIFAAILQVVAKILGGTGNYGKYAYLLAGIWVPISVVSALIGLVPVLGGCLGALLSIYALVLAFFATKVEHKLSQGRSIIVVLSPLVIGAILACCAVTVFASAMAAIFSSMQ